MSHIIREYTHKDTEGVRHCLVELQEFERIIDPERLEGLKVAHDYLAHLLDLCERGIGKIYVVEINGEIVGMTAIYVEDDTKHFRTSHRSAFISDLIVMKEHPNDGVIKELLEKAEEYAKSKKATTIQASVLKGHDDGTAGYLRNGFQEWEIRVGKRINDR